MKKRQGSKGLFCSQRPHDKMEALLAEGGSIEFPDERATLLWFSLDACPFPKN
jgi:hypothetical protein